MLSQRVIDAIAAGDVEALNACIGEMSRGPAPFQEVMSIFQQQPALLDKIDLNAALVGEDQGATVAWKLSATPSGRAIFKAHPALLERFDLDISIKSQKTIWQNLLDDIDEPLLQMLLTVRGLDTFVFFSEKVSAGAIKAMEAYREVFSLIEKSDFAGLEELLQKAPWLYRVKQVKTGNTLLHLIIQLLAKLEKDEQVTYLNKFENLFNQLQPLQNIENKNRFLPVDYAAASSVLREHFVVANSDLEKEFNLLFEANVDLFCDVLSEVAGIHALVEKLKKIIQTFALAIDTSPDKFTTQTKGRVNVLTDIMLNAENNGPLVKQFGVMFPMHCLSDNEMKTLEDCTHKLEGLLNQADYSKSIKNSL